MPHDVFISHASNDKAAVEKICAAIESRGIACWFAPRDVLAGAEYGKSIVSAIDACRVMVVILSASANESWKIGREVGLAQEKAKIIVPVKVEDVRPAKAMAYLLAGMQLLDAFSMSLDKSLPLIVDAVGQHLPLVERAPAIASVTPESKAKGYVFISYNKTDIDFVEKFKAILKRRGYAYWDYSESERDYHNALYRELEEKSKPRPRSCASSPTVGGKPNGPQQNIFTPKKQKCLCS